MDVFVTHDSSDPQERRVRQRISVAVDLELVAADFEVNAPSRTVNLSSHGAFVRTNKPLPIGTQVTVAFSRGKQRNPLMLDAVVVRAIPAQNGTPRGMGLQFTGLTALDENLVSALIDRAQT
ncbi:MAG: PilZ domain-containing protein [Nannocystaceae bacterium]